MRRGKVRWQSSLWIASLACLATMTPVPVTAQSLALEPDALPSRQQAFADLDRDVESLDAQLSIFKRVVQLVSPSVVHVEATPRPQYRLRRDAEEAGSAVLVRYRGLDYVLTNRHVIKHSDESLISLELSDGRNSIPSGFGKTGRPTLPSC